MIVGDAQAAFGVGGTSAQQPTSKSELGKEDFLRLLTTQLNNQDPLEPMDNTAFVAQMAEFSGLEQLMNMSESVSQLALAQAVGNGTQMVGFIGKEVAYMGDTVAHTEGQTHDIGVDLGGKAETMTVTVYDSDGTLVRTIESKGNHGPGMEEMSWDGLDNDGNPVPAGEYSMKVSAQDAEGERVDAGLRMRGVVSGVTYASGFPELIIGDQRIPVGQVMEVIEPGSDKSEADTEAPEDPETIEARFAPIDATPYRP